MSAQPTFRLAVTAILVTGLVASLAACAPEGDPSGESTQSAKPTPSKTPTPTPTKPPEFFPSGSATQNQPYFDYVNLASFSAYGFVDGISYIDALTNAGFNRAEMELTWWDTPDGHLADSIFFSVRINGECLIGQIAAWGYTSTVAPILGTGSCMVGDYLQPIN